MRAAVLVAVLSTLAPGLGARASGQPPSPTESAGVYHLTISGDEPLFLQTPDLTLAGTTDAPAGSTVEVVLGGARHTTRVAGGGAWSLAWPEPLAAGGYRATATVMGSDGRRGTAERTIVVQLPGRLARRPLVSAPATYAPPEPSTAGDFQAFTDRWRLVPPPYELDVAGGGRWDPYHQNRWKGDLPIRGQDLFLDLTGVSDTLVEGRTLPTPSDVSTARPGGIQFFGRRGQLFLAQNVFVSADLFKGDTAFRPIDWRIKATLAANVDTLAVGENGVVHPDVRDGTTRTTGFVTVQELYGEKKLADLSPNFDFISVRAGIQPFSSDFRGFVFTDTNLGVRLFGNAESNRDQYNLAAFDRLEKDTDSGLNRFQWRRQQVAVANVYRQDFLVPGYTAELSVHALRDEPSFEFDRNGFLARPDPVGSFTPHEIRAAYLGWAGLGHAGRLNLDHAVYWATGTDDLNPIAGRQVRIDAFFAALEVSIDHDWFRPKLGFLWASGDGRPADRTARGFDSIFDNMAFAGGGFSFWNRLGIRLAGTGVALVDRGSLLPDLRSSKDEGQPNFVNPGLRLATAGLDLDLTPKWTAVATANYLEFDRTETLELLLFQAPIHREIGWDLSLGARWRPFLNNQVVAVGGLAALLPGRGFRDIYDDRRPLAAAFGNLILTF
jgi:hypothetical protein